MDEMKNEVVENPVETVENHAEETGSVDYEKLYQQAANSVKELTAERDSLLNENNELRTARDAAIADGAKTKELNYTLARQLDVAQQTARAPEDIIAEMFLPKGGK